MKKYLTILVGAILSGLCIGIGVCVYLSLIEINKIVGSLLFGFGLYTIIIFSFWLYTGKVGAALDNKPSYILDLIVCLLGNFIGICSLTGIMKLTRYGNSLSTQATALVNAKENDTWYSILILAFMCGIMIYLAVKGHNSVEHPLGKVVMCFLAISIFILCGFEHCVANAGYYVLAGIFTWKSLLNFVLMIIGNAMGSIFFDGMLKLYKKLMTNNKNN